MTLTVVPFIQKSCWNCGILFRAWFDTGWIWIPCLRMVRLEFYFYICVFQAASWLHFFCPKCVSCMHLATIFPSVWRIPPPPHKHVSLPSTSIAGTCTTWQKIASSTMMDSTEHDFRAHIVDLFHEKNKWKRRERKSSCLPKVKWTDFKELWAVRKLRNYQCRSIPELHNQTRSKSVRCIH